MKAVIEPSGLKGEIYAPPSKSYAHRLLICAALAGKGSTVEGISQSGDMKATLNCIRALGAEVSQRGSCVCMESSEKKQEEVPVLNCSESGSTLRFFIPISLVFSKEALFTGTERLIARGIGVYEDMLKASGIVFEKSPSSIRVKGKLKSGNYVMRGDVSSQFASGMLFALPLLKGDSSLTVKPPVESRSYIDITIDALKTFGIEIEENPKNSFKIKGGQTYIPESICVEGDWSNGAFLYGFNALGAELEIKGLKEDSVQGDKACVGMFKALEEEDPLIDISNCPDLGPVLFAAAAAKGGGSFTGIKRLRIKESDRAAAMAEELKKFGISCEIEENSMTVKKGKLGKPEEILNGHNDHRIVMSLTLLSSLTGAEIEGAQAVRKSWPGFFEDMQKLGLKAVLKEE